MLNINKSIFNLKEKDFVKLDRDINELSYYTQLTRFLISMFDYENMPDTMPSRFVELYLNYYGSVVLGEIDGKPIAVPPNLNGNVDAYGLGTEAFGVCPIGEVRGVRGVDVVWGLNNSTASPSYEVLRASHQLSELDVSILNNIHYSRMHPIPVARDTKTKVAIDSAMNDIDTGYTKSILSDNVVNELDSGLKMIDVINLTDVKEQDKLQYLYHSKDDVLRQFFTQFGQSVQGTGKMAQQTEREIDGSTSVSFIDPLDRLKCRREMVEEFNRIFNTNISVKLSESWANEWKHYSELGSANASADGVADDVDDVTQEGADNDET